mmetsp:Transcript_23679/g.58777  ORF Transcript_23679/g.58777 Transcript_23679/m.58777 type:complete len:128 (+) Transcript_23679:363-746(+)
MVEYASRHRCRGPHVDEWGEISHLAIAAASETPACEAILSPARDARSCFRVFASRLWTGALTTSSVVSAEFRRTFDCRVASSCSSIDLVMLTALTDMWPKLFRAGPAELLRDGAESPALARRRPLAV